MSWLSTHRAQRASRLRRHAQFVPPSLCWFGTGGWGAGPIVPPQVFRWLCIHSLVVFTADLPVQTEPSTSTAQTHTHTLAAALRQFRRKDPTQTHNDTTERCCSRLKHTRARNTQCAQPAVTTATRVVQRPDNATQPVQN